jgi:hypothetical protein
MVAHNLIMIHIKGVTVGNTTLVLVTFNSTHNLMSKVFAPSLSHPIGNMDPSWILLPNGQVHNINLFMKNVLIQFLGLEIYIDFQVWPRSIYDIILSMQWLDPMDTLVACKHGLVYHIKLDGFICELIGM